MSANFEAKKVVVEEIKAKMGELFFGGCCDDKATKQTIADLFDEYGYLCDTHTAVALAVGENYRKESGDNTLQVIASTASAYKFAPAVLKALTDEELPADDFAKLELLAKLTGTRIPAPLANLKGAEILHNECIEKENMAAYIRGKLG